MREVEWYQAEDTKVADNWRELQFVEEETGNRLRIKSIRK
jgi:hypothetical protein